MKYSVIHLSALISVVIPVYNAEKYLYECLYSVINQSYKNLEIICVDDGSTDGSGKIVDEFAAHDSRIVVIHQTNHGESHARNVGLDAARGDYIALVDDDDWLEPDMYETLLQKAEETSVDIVCSSWIKESGKISQKAKNNMSVAEGVFGRDVLLYYIYRRDDYQGFAYMWDKLYKKELFDGVRFDETIKIGGDVLALAEVALRTDRATYMDEAFYHYRQLNSSGSHTKNAIKLLDWIKAYEMVAEKFENNNVQGETMLYVKRFMAYTAERAARAAIESVDIESYEKAANIMRANQNEYELTNKKFPERIKEFRDILKWGH